MRRASAPPAAPPSIPRRPPLPGRERRAGRGKGGEQAMRTGRRLQGVLPREGLHRAEGVETAGQGEAPRSRRPREAPPDRACLPPSWPLRTTPPRPPLRCTGRRGRPSSSGAARPAGFGGKGSPTSAAGPTWPSSVPPRSSRMGSEDWPTGSSSGTSRSAPAAGSGGAGPVPWGKAWSSLRKRTTGETTGRWFPVPVLPSPRCPAE